MSEHVLRILGTLCVDVCTVYGIRFIVHCVLYCIVHSAVEEDEWIAGLMGNGRRAFLDRTASSSSSISPSVFTECGALFLYVARCVFVYVYVHLLYDRNLGFLGGWIKRGFGDGREERGW